MANKRKRQSRTSKRKPRAKRQRPRIVNDEVSTLKIDDVNNDCLEHIFNYLSLMDLINVADANKHLVQAAALVFAHKFKGKSIDIQIYSHLSHYCNMRSIEITDDVMAINKPKPAFQILRLFGAVISNIKISSYSSKELINELFTYVNENCSESLKTITIEHGPNFVLEKPKKPFENVKEVSITYGPLCLELSLLNEIFPQMRRLKLFVHLRNYKRSSVKFHRLEELEIFCPTGYSVHTIKDIVRLNPQIKNLKVFGEVELGFWDYVSKQLKQLKVLNLRYGHSKSSQYNKDPIRFECVEVLKMRVYSGSRNSNPRILFAFKQLKECKISTYDFDENLCNFIIENPKIEKLNIILPYYQSIPFAVEQNVLKIAEKLPKLTELSMTGRSCSVDGAIRILNAIQTLRKFSLTVLDTNDSDELYSADIPEWNATKKPGSITFERK